MKGLKTLNKLRLAREIYKSSAIFNAPMHEHKNPHRSGSGALQQALPSFREADEFGLDSSVAQHSIHLVLRPNNTNKNKAKNLKGGLVRWLFQALRQWSEEDLGKMWGGW